MRLLALALALSQLACSGRSNEDRPQAASGTVAGARPALPPCREISTVTTGWQEATARDGLLTLRLPPGSATISSSQGEIWNISAGTFAYRFAPIDQRWYDSVSTDSAASRHGWCAAEIGGAPALVQYVYSPNAATGPGYYLQIYRHVSNQTDLRLIGFARDTMRAPVLLEIARSVRLRQGKTLPR